MARDPHIVLGLGAGATQAQVKAAFHALAKRWHPDFNPGDQVAEARFKEVAAAYAALRRAGLSQPVAAGPFMPGDELAMPDFVLGGDDDAAPVDFGPSGARGADLRYRLTLTAEEAAAGGVWTVALADGTTAEVPVPPGTAGTHVVFLAERGLPGADDGPPGDAMVEVIVAPADDAAAPAGFGDRILATLSRWCGHPRDGGRP